jgi:3-phosphoshikimate 1-carboxyvinyltransferase
MQNHTWPKTIEIKPLTLVPEATIEVPGSKSITNRALILAAMGSRVRPYTLRNVLHSEDTQLMAQALTQLGFDLQHEGQDIVHCRGISRNGSTSVSPIPATHADLFVGNSGTSMRFLTALVSLGHGSYRLDGVPRMRERPIRDLLDSLNQLGCEARGEITPDFPPVIIDSKGWTNRTVNIRGDVSSQFLTGLLLAAPFAEAETTIELTGELVSEPYIDMTLRMLSQWGLVYSSPKQGIYTIEGQQQPKAFDDHSYIIEPDASAASYFFAAAAITQGRITVLGMTDDSLQGDVKFVDLLEQMGCRVEKCSSGITVHGRPLCGVDVDMNAISDTTMTLAAVACFADSPTTIRNVAHIRHKETDRLAALATELRRLGGDIEETADGLKIIPRPLRGTLVETYNDHRMAMSLSLIGLKIPGVVIDNPACVAKTYPGFFNDFERLSRV